MIGDLPSYISQLEVEEISKLKLIMSELGMDIKDSQTFK